MSTYWPMYWVCGVPQKCVFRLSGAQLPGPPVPLPCLLFSWFWKLNITRLQEFPEFQRICLCAWEHRLDTRGWEWRDLCYSLRRGWWRERDSDSSHARCAERSDGLISKLCVWKLSPTQSTRPPPCGMSEFDLIVFYLESAAHWDWVLLFLECY